MLYNNKSNEDFLNCNEIFNSSLYINFLNYIAVNDNIDEFVDQFNPQEIWKVFISKFNYSNINIDDFYKHVDVEKLINKLKNINNEDIKLCMVNLFLKNNLTMPAITVNRYLPIIKRVKIEFPPIIHDYVEYTHLLKSFDENFNIFSYITKEYDTRNMTLMFIHNDEYCSEAICDLVFVNPDKHLNQSSNQIA